MPSILDAFSGKLRSVSFPVLVFLFALTASAPAQGIKSLMESFGGAGSAQAAPEQTPAEQLQWAELQLKEAKEMGKAESAFRIRLAEAGLPAARIEDFLAANREIQRNYQGSLDIISAFTATDARQSSPVPVPTSEKEASAMRDSLRRAVIAEKSADGETDLIRQWVSQYQALQTNAEREVRQLREEADTARSPEAKVRAEVLLELAELQGRAAASTVFYGKWKEAQQEAAAQKASGEADALRMALRAGGFDRQLDVRRADSQLAKIQLETSAVEKEVAAATKEQSRVLAEAASLREKADSPTALIRASAADVLSYSTQGLVSALQAGLLFLDEEKKHWIAVKTLAGNPNSEDLRERIAKTGETLRRQKELRPSIERRLLEARESLDSAQKQLSAGVADSVTKSLLERTVDSAQKRVDSLGALLTKSDQMYTTQEEFLGELQSLLGREGALQKMTRAWSGFSRMVSRIWEFELFGIGDTRITTGKVLMAVLGLLLAILAARGVSRWTSRTAGRRFQMVEDQKSLLEKSVFVPVAATLVLTVLYWLNIPLTVFAFLGGALAIGLGFGAQNLVNNFISGIILLLERQIKVGDIIEVAGSTGKVTHLGSRCSRIRKFDGVELLVPNSMFLEKEVTNWTLADPQHRYDFTIGVAYGSPVEKVTDLLESALERQPEILREPVPGVFFEAFGDSALVFRIYYWIDLSGAVDARKVGSELRCRIDRDFRAAGIEIPFPQRDLHLRSSSPIPVRWEEKPTSPPPPAS